VALQPPFLLKAGEGKGIKMLCSCTDVLPEYQLLPAVNGCHFGDYGKSWFCETK
jgi:hypothetical protein